MGRGYIKDFFCEFGKRTEFFSSNKIDIAVNEDLEKNNKYEYVVDSEIKIIPRNLKSLGVTIWFSGNAIGFFVESYRGVAGLIGCKVSTSQSELACAGTEPTIKIDVDSLCQLVENISNAKIELYAGVMFGHLKGVYTSIKLKNNEVIDSSIGYPRLVIKVLSKIGLAELTEVPYEPW